MSDKRFIVFPNNVVWDNQLNEVVCRCILEGIGDAENVCQRMNQQQDTIIKLQDLCGESDSENAKLRIENKELQEEIKLLKPVNIEQYEQIVQLQEENEQLRQQLKEKEEDEQLYANEIVELRKTNEEWLQFKDLGGDY